MSKVVNNAAVQAVESGTSDRITQNEATLRREAETQAAKVQEAVNDAAEVAQEKFSDGNSTDNFQHDLAEKTNEAVEEGKRDVENAKSAGQSYIEQAKLYTESMVATTQAYIEDGKNKLTGQGHPTTVGNDRGVISGLQSAAATAQQTLQPHVEQATNMATSAAQFAGDAVRPHFYEAVEAAKPYVQSAKESIQPHIDVAVAKARPYVESAKGNSSDQGRKVNPACEG